MFYYVSVWEQGPDSYTLEVCDELWNVYERVTNIPFNEVRHTEAELMRKWKLEMAKYGLSPALAYNIEMEG